LCALLPITSAEPELKASSVVSLQLRLRTRSMASPAAAPAAKFTQVEAARQSLIAISQSVPEFGAPVARPPNGGMEHGHDDGAEQGYRAKLISISNQSPDARPVPCPPNNAAA
ncbi:unnamed protein product, partial [Urochloa humidicola]